MLLPTTRYRKWTPSTGNKSTSLAEEMLGLFFVKCHYKSRLPVPLLLPENDQCNLVCCMSCVTENPQLCSLIEIHNVIQITICGFLCQYTALSVTFICVCLGLCEYKTHHYLSELMLSLQIHRQIDRQISFISSVTIILHLWMGSEQCENILICEMQNEIIVFYAI